MFRIRLPRRDDERVKRVLLLMLPVSVGLGLININLLLNSVIGSLVSEQVPRAIDAAFRIYMLPQGMFSVAVATVLFPQLARLAARGDQAGAARHHERRPAADRAPADSGGRGDDRALGADGAARVRARRVHAGIHAS